MSDTKPVITLDPKIVSECIKQHLTDNPITMPQSGFIRLKNLRRFVPWGDTTTWQKSKDPADSFPMYYKLSGGITAWSCEELHAYFNSIKRQPTQDAANDAVIFDDAS